MLWPDRAAEEHVPQSPRRGPEPYGRRGGNIPSSGTVGRARGRGLAIPNRYRPENEVDVDVIFSAHSDGLMAILRKA